MNRASWSGRQHLRSEALFRPSFNPLGTGSISLKRHSAGRCHPAVLEAALAAGAPRCGITARGTAIRVIQVQLLVYGRAGEPCTACGRASSRSELVSGPPISAGNATVSRLEESLEHLPATVHGGLQWSLRGAQRRSNLEFPRHEIASLRSQDGKGAIR